MLISKMGFPKAKPEFCQYLSYVLMIQSFYRMLTKTVRPKTILSILLPAFQKTRWPYH